MRKPMILVLCLLLCGCGTGTAEESAAETPQAETVKPAEKAEQPSGDACQIGPAAFSTGAVVQVNGAAYGLRYDCGSFEAGGLWGSYAALPDTENQLVRYEDTGREALLCSGPWFGPLWVLGDRLVAERVTEEGTGLVCLSLSGEVLWNCEGENAAVQAADQARGLLICSDGWTVFSLDGEGNRTDLGESVRFLAYEDGVLYVQDAARRDEAILRRLTLDGQRTELARVTVEYGGNSGPTITQVEPAGDMAYFLYGSYDGTANVFQGGYLAAVSLDGSGCRELAETVSDKFFLREKNGCVTLLYPPADQQVWDGETALELNPATGEITETEKPVWFQPVGVPFADGDAIRMVTDRTGATVTLAEDLRFPATAYDGENPKPWREIRDIAVTDEWLWYTLEVGRWSEEYSIGWRDGYERVLTQACRMPLAGGGTEVLYEY